MKFDERKDGAVWRSFTGGGVTVATLIKMARDAGWKPEAQRQAKPYSGDRRPGRVVAQYLYLDEQGNFLYRKTRIEFDGGGKITPFQRYEDGRWIGGAGCMQGVRRVLYRLPWVVPARRVFIVEGEKCSDALWDFGIVATTADSGAKHWRPEYTEVLKDKDVVVLPDNDEAGREHALKVAAAVRKVARSLRLLELPGLGPKDDVADFIANGGGNL